MSSSAQGAQINLAAQTTVQTLLADTAATVQGQGTVETTQANVDGVVIEAPAKKVFLADGVQANVAGKTITEDYKYVEPKKKKSRDAALSDLMIDGITVAGFAPETMSYDFVLPYGSTKDDLPIVTAEAHHAKARVEITQATGLTAPDNTATVVVTAENGRTQTYIVRFTVAENSAKAITAFRFEAFDPEVVGFIDEEANPKTIAVTVPYGTDVTTLVPTIEHTGASISPASGISQNFTDSVTYTVTAADGSTAEYEVTVTIASNSEASLTSLAVNPGTIDFDAGTYTYDDVIVPYGTETVEVTFAAIAGATMDLDSPHTVTITDGVGTFSVEVTAEDGVTKQIYTINFVEAVPVTGVTLDKETVTLAVGEEETLSATVSPADASNQTVTWASSETNVATVDDNGVVTAVGVGEATITVTTEDGNKTDTCTVTVNPAPLTDFACTGNNGTGATFTWTAADGATGIKIEQSTDAGTTWTTAYTAPLEATANTAKVVGLTAGATYKFKLVVTGGNNEGDSNEVEVTTSIEDANTYGASWDSSTGSTAMTRLGDAESAPKVSEGATPAEIGSYFDECAPWRGMKLCNVADDGTITAYIGRHSSFKRDGSNGQVMVKIPKFYYKHTYDEGTKKHEFWVADGPAEGFKLHPVFLRAGVEKPYVLLGAYKASLGRNQTDTVDALASVSGALPAVSKKHNPVQNVSGGQRDRDRGELDPG
ncbi:MAG: Ig-like domain-containing protein [Peptococcia bacterium]